MKIVNTHTGKIYVDTDRKLEFLTVGDYGKENNIKADFLGLKKEINGVKNTPVNLEYKWVATISSQKGCPMHCQFCDCPKFGFYGNVSVEELGYQIKKFLKVNKLKRQIGLMFILPVWESRLLIRMLYILLILNLIT